MNFIRHLQLTLAAGAATLAFTALPIGFDASTMTVHLAQAVADNSNGHANGNANGHANSKANGQSKGATADGLGSLNAAHASDTALDNANMDSQVGRIAAYRDLEVAAKKAAADAAADDQTVAGKQELLDAALAANADGDPLNDIDQATIDGLTQDVVDAKTAAAEADAAALDAQTEADAALVDASNKDITDDGGNVLSDIRDAVNNLLGID